MNLLNPLSMTVTAGETAPELLAPELDQGRLNGLVTQLAVEGGEVVHAQVSKS